MLIKTHLAGILFFIILLFSKINYSIVFISVALLATFIPDMDTKFSTLGSKKIFRPFQLFMKHRGIFHSFSFLFVLTMILALFLPVVALPFFLGYGLHLFLDSFTIEGIAPFYPSKKRISGKIRNGGKTENFVFIILILLDLGVLFLKFL